MIDRDVFAEIDCLQFFIFESVEGIVFIMNLFNLVTVFGLLLSSNLFAAGSVENEDVHPPCLLRGVTVKGQARVDIVSEVSEDRSRVPARIIEGQFSIVSQNMDWSKYWFQNVVGLFWTENEIKAYKTLIATGVKFDFDPESPTFFLLEENLRKMIVTAGQFEITLWDALMKHKIDDANGILVIDK